MLVENLNWCDLADYNVASYDQEKSHFTLILVQNGKKVPSTCDQQYTNVKQFCYKNNKPKNWHNFFSYV